MAGQTPQSALAAGHRLGRYEIVRSLAVDDLGVRYAARDHDADVDVWMREYLPQSSAAREADGSVGGVAEGAFDIGLARFLADGGVLARLDHPGVARVRDRLRANGTVYLVTDAGGTTLDALLGSTGVLSEGRLRKAVEPLIDGLQQVHSVGLVHRRIRPDNIVVRSDGALALTDFGTAQGRAGGARGSFATAAPLAVRPPSVMAGAGYLAPEQYTERAQEGPWTDVYALGAVLYRCVTGRVPLDALQRALQDDMPPAAQAVNGDYGPAFLAAIDAALTIRPIRRPRTVGEWRPALADGARAASSHARMAARGARRPPSAAGSDTRVSSGVRRWTVPAALLLGAMGALTWLDTGLLRAGDPSAAERDGVTAPRPPPRAAAGPDAQRPPAGVDTTEGVAQDREASAGRPATEAEAAASRPPDEESAGSEEDRGRVAPAADGASATDGAQRVPERAGGDSAAELAPEPAPPAADGPEAVAAVGDATPAPLAEAALTVETAPAGVGVWIGGERVGETPLSLAGLPAGTYDVSLRHPHYRTLDLPAREFAPLGHVRIERALTRATGDLRVTTEPPGAWIEWGDGEAGGPTPTTLRGLPAGPLQLRLGAPGYLAQQVSTDVRRDDTGLLEVVLAAAYGTLTLDLEPGDAAVGVAGPAGGPYAPGMRLPEGPHDLEVSRSGYRSTTQTVHVVGDTRLRIALEPERRCPLRVRGTVPAPRYPVVRTGRGQRSVGSANVVVTFTVDDDGRVAEEDLRVEAERSTVELPEYFDRFASAATDTVRQYRFAFEEVADGVCTKRQRAGVRVRFRVPAGLL